MGLGGHAYTPRWPAARSVVCGICSPHGSVHAGPIHERCSRSVSAGSFMPSSVAAAGLKRNAGPATYRGEDETASWEIEVFTILGITEETEHVPSDPTRLAKRYPGSRPVRPLDQCSASAGCPWVLSRIATFPTTSVHLRCSTASPSCHRGTGTRPALLRRPPAD